jgi:hypothetical protein
MSKVSLASLVASTTLLLATVALAGEADTATAVLGLEALDGVPDTVAADITDALRQRIAGTKGYQLVQGKDLVEVKLVFSCPDEAPPCLSQAAKSMGANKLIFGNVKRSGSDFLITLKLLDANRVSIESWAAETVPKKRAEPAVFRSLAPAWLATLAGKTTGGSLQVRANVSGAAVTLDGTKVGVTGDQPVAIPDVTAGHHEVAVEKGGYTTAKQEFTLASGQSLPLSLTLSSVSTEGSAERAAEPLVVERPAGHELPPDGSSRSLARAGFWIAVVGTVAAAGAALKFGNDVRQINSELDPLRRFSCPTSTDPNAQCGADGKSAAMLTQPQIAQRNTLTDDGNKRYTLELICLGLIPPFAIAGGYFLYKGYLESGGEKEANRTSSNHGLRIFPTASASAGGIIAEFDF